MPATVFTHGLPPTPSSMRPSQSLSMPSQLSVVGSAAEQSTQPPRSASHDSVPRHVPSAFVFVQVRTWPCCATVHEHVDVRGTQKLPTCWPLGSSPHV